ncbi:hypothetical protein SK128_027045, partial [Halocaridina rubra]
MFIFNWRTPWHVTCNVPFWCESSSKILRQSNYRNYCNYITISLAAVSTVITNYADHHAADHYGGTGAMALHEQAGPHLIPASNHTVAHVPSQLVAYPSPSSTPQHMIPNSQHLSHQVLKQIPVLEPLDEAAI